MKNLILIALFACLAVACNNAGTPVTQNAAPPSNVRPQTAIAHSSENKVPMAPSSEKSKWTQSGDPIDTKKFDEAIAAAEVALHKSPNDQKAKKALADAYFARAEALTGARQYASALGDYRRTIKHDPANTDAKNWIDQITGIYDSMGRESPPEGEEPQPLPYKGGKDEK